MALTRRDRNGPSSGRARNIGRMRLLSRLLLPVLGGLLVTAAAAAGAPGPGTVVDRPAGYPGIQHLRYEYGPIRVTPGQNSIDFRPNVLMPQVPGYITRFKPDLIYADHKRGVPRVDVIHLHHGVWIINGRPQFAAGEEKTITNVPQGFGIHHKPGDNWVMNYMVHNLTPNADSVYITYEIDFVPDSAAAAATITPAHITWLDVAGIAAYPVFDALRGQGTKGVYRFPEQARGRQRSRIGAAATWAPGQDITLLAMAGHLHPGGLANEIYARRGGAERKLFRSDAVYFEPAGAVSWDVAMTATPPDWKVAVRAGDTLRLSTLYDTRRASWYEVMGIMPVIWTDGIVPGAKDPFNDVIATTGSITHGPLRENRNHGGGFLGLPDARRLAGGTTGGRVAIRNFTYGRGDLASSGRAGRPPLVRRGGTLTFDNAFDNARGAIYHTITGCRAPCNRATGIAYPIADGGAFDSGELGTGPAGATAAANRLTWSVPKTLRPGTYTYFCRVHPFMRGAFRVVKGPSRRR